LNNKIENKILIGKKIALLKQKEVSIIPKFIEKIKKNTKQPFFFSFDGTAIRLCKSQIMVHIWRCKTN
jgi:hypothetical protein